MTAAAPKKPLFSKPAWATAKSSTEPTSDTGGIFGRSTVYEDILEADRQKRAKREAKAKVKAQTYAEAQKSEERQRKRRRTFGEGDEEEQEDKGSNSDADSPGEETDSGNNVEEDEEYKPRVTRSTPKKNKTLTRGLEESRVESRSPTKPTTRKRAIISLDDDDDEDADIIYGHTVSTDGKDEEVREPFSEEMKQISMKSQRNLRKQSSESEDDEEEEDEYLRELKQRARQKIRDAKVGLRNADKENGRAGVHQISQSSSRNLTSITAPEDQSGHQISNVLSQSELSTSAYEDPIVHIRITSKIPNTEELIVKRHASQPLRHVRDYWCKSQNFGDSFASRVFLTWRGTQLFNSTTTRSIIHRLQKEAGTSDGSDPSHGRIEVEAMIPEIFDLRKRQREKEIMEEAGLKIPGNGNQENGNEEDEDELIAKSPLPDSNNDAGAIASEGTRTKEDAVIRLVCQGLEPVIMRVRPSSKISKIMSVFEKMRHVSPEKTCWLVFDGERLEPNSTVQDVGLEDEDTVEIYLR